MSEETTTSFISCPRCLNRLVGNGGYRCVSCKQAYMRGPVASTLAINPPEASFAQELDAFIDDELLPALESANVPTCTEHIISSVASRKNIQIGNPIWEGRADVLRKFVTAESVVFDVGCGFGTNAVALARSAKHVFALDESSRRVALTAARAKAEGLRNVTAIHSSGLELPAGSQTCDVVTIIGVLEWVGARAADPTLAQTELLREVHRILKPGGVLILGIENRYAAHYFAGAREEHVELPFASLLPRRVTSAYVKAARNSRYFQYTYSRWALERLITSAGLTPRFGSALPSYSQPQFTFDEADDQRARLFYLRHLFHPTSFARRAGGRALAVAPSLLFRAVTPSFFVVASRDAAPQRIPTMVTGTPYCDGYAKTVHWDSHSFGKQLRRGGPETASSLIDGWAGRSWIGWPFRESARAHRRRRLAGMAAAKLSDRAVRELGSNERLRLLNEAHETLNGLPNLGTATKKAIEDILRIHKDSPLQAQDQHNDFVLSNLIVKGDELHVVDTQDASLGFAGHDALILALDLLGARGGRQKQLNLKAGVAALLTGDPNTLYEVEPLLQLVPTPVTFSVLSLLKHKRLRSDTRGIEESFDLIASSLKRRVTS